jgi:hypothetical protein
VSDVTRHRAFKLNSLEKDSLSQMTRSHQRDNGLVAI